MPFTPCKSAAPPVKPARKPAHRPPYVPTDKDRLTVKVMIAGGIEQDAIAGVLGIAPKTLRKHFRPEINNAAAEMHGRVVASLFAMATTGKNFHAAKWITEARMGWSERVTVIDGGAEADLKTLSDADLEARIARLTAKPARAVRA